MLVTKSPAPRQALSIKPPDQEYNYFQFWNQTLKVKKDNRPKGRNETGWNKQKGRIRGNWLQDQILQVMPNPPISETGQTFDKEQEGMRWLRKWGMRK